MFIGMSETSEYPCNKKVQGLKRNQFLKGVVYHNYSPWSVSGITAEPIHLK